MRLRLRTLMAGTVALMFALAAVAAKDMPPLDRYYPMFLGTIGFILSVAVFTQEIRRKEDAKTATDAIDIVAEESLLSRAAYKRAAGVLGWFLALYVGMWVLGFKIGITLWVILFLKLAGKVKWPLTIVLTGIIGYLIFFHFEYLLNVYSPDGLLQRWIDLPWLQKSG